MKIIRKNLVSALLAVTAMVMAGAAMEAAAATPGSTSKAPAALQDVACPTATACIAVGGSGGDVLVSSNGGTTWSRHALPTKHFLYDVACSDPMHCAAVGDDETAVFTKNAGKSWSLGDTGVSVPLSGVSCPQLQHCVAVGDDETVLATSDGGLTWNKILSQFGVMDGVSCTTSSHCVAVTSNVDVTLVTNDGTEWSPAPAPFSALAVLKPANGVACVSTSCVEVADHGLIAHSGNGGTSWSAGTTATLEDLYDASCSSTTVCVAVGAGGTILRTSDGGGTWSSVAAPTAQTLLGVSCPSANACIAAGSGGTIMTSADGGETWIVRAGSPAPSQASVLVVGDSFSGTLAEGLARDATAYGVAVTNGSIDGCDLARGEPILLKGQPYVQHAGPCVATGPGWAAQYQQDLALAHPAVSVLVLGPFDQSTRMINGQWESPGQADYDAYYVQQITSALQILTSQGGHVVITTAPFVQSTGPQYCAPLPAKIKGCPTEAQRVAAQDAAAKQSAAGFPGKVTIVSLGQHLAPHGKYTSTVDGVVVRAADGVHLSEPGGEWLTPWLLPRITAAAPSAG
jgi:photosystem II stability/assembly factor-like uncharacterized protein